MKRCLFAAMLMTITLPGLIVPAMAGPRVLRRISTKEYTDPRPYDQNLEDNTGWHPHNKVGLVGTFLGVKNNYRALIKEADGDVVEVPLFHLTACDLGYILNRLAKFPEVLLSWHSLGGNHGTSIDWKLSTSWGSSYLAVLSEDFDVPDRDVQRAVPEWTHMAYDGPSGWFRGYIGDLKLYDRALNESEIRGESGFAEASDAHPGAGPEGGKTTMIRGAAFEPFPEDGSTVNLLGDFRWKSDGDYPHIGGHYDRQRWNWRRSFNGAIALLRWHARPLTAEQLTDNMRADFLSVPHDPVPKAFTTREGLILELQADALTDDRPFTIDMWVYCEEDRDARLFAMNREVTRRHLSFGFGGRNAAALMTPGRARLDWTTRNDVAGRWTHLA